MPIVNTSNFSNIAEIGVRPNLLDNYNFTVNQLGQMSYNLTAGEERYVFDRWKLNATGVMSYNEDEQALIMNYDESTADPNMIQPMYRTFQTGETITISIVGKGNIAVFLSGNNKLYGTFYLNSKEYTMKSNTFTLEETIKNPSFMIQVNDKKVPWSIKAVKMEVGDSQSLAYQAKNGNWLIYPQPDDKPGAMLAECQRYRLVLNPKKETWHEFGGASMSTASAALLQVPTPVTMRPVKSVTVSSGNIRDLVVKFNTNDYIPVTQLDIYRTCSNLIMFRAHTEESRFTSGGFYTVMNQGLVSLIIDAN